MAESGEQLSKTELSKTLPRSMFYSFLTQVAPVLIALLVIPRLISGLGDDRFGLLTLVWVFLGYFTFFDLGLGRATTKFVSEYIAREDWDGLPELIWTSWLLLMVLGFVAAIIILLLVPLLTGGVLKIPPELQDESRRSFFLVGLSVPIVIITTGIRAVLEAFQRFKTIAAINVPASLLTYLIPFFALFYTARLEIIIALLWLNRLVFMIFHLYVCVNTVPALKTLPKPDLALLRPLVQFGGWLTVTNIIGPLMTYLDRFLVGALLSVAQVTYYVTPYEMVRRLKVIPASIMTVLFPTFSGLNATDVARSTRLFHLTTRLLFLIASPIMISIVVLANDLLTLWIDEAFALRSTPVLQWLAVGVLINFIGQVAYNWVQSTGRSDLPAKLHMVELPIYLLAIWVLAQSFGIVGVAIAWTVRVALDTVMLFLMAKNSLASTNRSFSYMTSLVILAVSYYAAILMLVQSTTNIMLHFTYTAVVTVIYGVISWRWFLSTRERLMVLSHAPFIGNRFLEGARTP